MEQLPSIQIKIKLSEIASYLECELVGEDVLLDGFNLSNRDIVANSVLSYCGSGSFVKIANNNASVKALVLTKNLYETLEIEQKKRFSFLLSDTPEWNFYKAFIHAINLDLYPQYDWDTQLNDSQIMENSIVESGVIIGKNVIIGPNSVVKSGTIIGDNVTIGSCSVIGSDGFQLIKDDKGLNHTIPHVGRTYIGNNVSIGDNVTISKSLFEGYTYIDDYVKIDNQVHIGHNCKVEENSVITANSTMFGSSSVGKNVWIAPHCAIMNRVHVGDKAFVCACSFVWRNVKEGTKVGGNPAHRIKEF